MLTLESSLKLQRACMSFKQAKTDCQSSAPESEDKVVLKVKWSASARATCLKQKHIVLTLFAYIVGRFQQSFID